MSLAARRHRHPHDRHRLRGEAVNRAGHAAVQRSKSGRVQTRNSRYLPRVSIVPPSYVNVPGKPFDNDAFELRTTAERLSNLVRAETEPLVMTVSAPWGQGKTTFCQEWEKLLRQGDTQTLWFNAWEEDHAEDPLLSFLDTLRRALIEARSDAAKQGGKRQEKVEAAIVEVLDTGGKLVLNAATLGGMPIIQESFKRWRQEQDAKDPKAWLDDALKDHDRAKKVITDFRAALAGFAALTPEPLVVFVDELDRCRPAFAVGLLERIKHLFSVPGLVFVLAVDRQQLGDAARAHLGFGEDRAKVYLERFIHFDFQLPEPDRRAYAERLAQAHEEHAGAGAYVVLGQLLGFFTPSLRKMDQIFARMRVLLTLVRGSTPEHWDHVPYLLMLDGVFPDRFQKVLKGDGDDGWVEGWFGRIDAEMAAERDYPEVQALALFFAMVCGLSGRDPMEAWIKREMDVPPGEEWGIAHRLPPVGERLEQRLRMMAMSRFRHFDWSAFSPEHRRRKIREVSSLINFTGLLSLPNNP